LRRLREPIGQQARWLEVMEEFDFVVEHRPGTKHGNADALSRRPCGKRNCACRIPVNAASDEQLGAQAEQEVDADENILTRVVVSREVNSGDEEQGEPGAFIGEAVDQLDTSVSAVESESQRESPGELCRSSEVSAVDAEVQAPWSLAGLQAGQRNDPHIGFITRQFENSECRPTWNIVALKSDMVTKLKTCLGDTPVSWLNNDSCPLDSLQQTQFSEAPICRTHFRLPLMMCVGDLSRAGYVTHLAVLLIMCVNVSVL